jgi:DNA-binding NarL/FixJ family response regulator
MRGETYLTPRVSRTVVEGMLGDAAPGADPLAGLTQRQREILQLIAEGRSTKEIAGILDVSVKTVETHRARLMERLGIHDVAGLVRFAIKAGLVE